MEEIVLIVCACIIAVIAIACTIQMCCVQLAGAACKAMLWPMHCGKLDCV
jgi:hypothetical protein